MVISDSELKVLEVIWENGDCKASDIAKILEKKCGWAFNTTYTVIKRAINKGFIKRTDPGFICSKLISREEVQNHSIEEVREKYYNNSNINFIKTLISQCELSDNDIDEIYSVIHKESRVKKS